MHANNVIHRDIKSDNILCSTDGLIKIADLGESTILDKQDKKKEEVGTTAFMPPEILRGKEHNQ